jgi:hypothetical protein
MVVDIDPRKQQQMQMQQQQQQQQQMMMEDNVNDHPIEQYPEQQEQEDAAGGYPYYYYNGEDGHTNTNQNSSSHNNNLRTVTMMNHSPSLGSISTADEEEDRNQKQKQAEQEFEKTVAGLGMKKAVQYSRMAVLLLLLMSAVGLATFIYWFIQQSEQDQFQLEFEQNARKVVDHLGTEWEFTLGTVEAFITTSLTMAAVTNQTYPYVNQPAFAVRAAKLRSLTEALVISTYPLVTTEQRSEWEQYSITQDEWVTQAIQVQQNDVNFLGRSSSSSSSQTKEDIYIEDKIHGNNGIHYGTGPYLPTWETYPMVPLYAPYNWDIRLVRYGFFFVCVCV